jgi:hypothetical protein
MSVEKIRFSFCSGGLSGPVLFIEAFCGVGSGVGEVGWYIMWGLGGGG